MSSPLGDLEPQQFRDSAQYLVDWLAEYLGPESRPEPVLSQVKPGEIRATQSETPPAEGQEPLKVLQEFREQLSAGLTHWNSPTDPADPDKVVSRSATQTTLLHIHRI